MKDTVYGLWLDHIIHESHPGFRLEIDRESGKVLRKVITVRTKAPMPALPKYVPRSPR